MVCADEDGAVIVTAAKVYANQWGGGRVEACCIHCLRVRRDVLLVTTRFSSGFWGGLWQTGARARSVADDTGTNLHA